MRPTAPNAPLRPFQMARLSSADWDTRMLIGSNGRQSALMRASRAVLLGDAAFDLNDQQRLGVQRVAGVGEGLAGVDRRDGP